MSKHRIDAAKLPAHNRSVEKKSEAVVGQASSLYLNSKKKETGAMHVLSPCPLLDTRAVYFGDNLEQLASHYVKIMRIFGEIFFVKTENDL